MARCAQALPKLPTAAATTKGVDKEPRGQPKCAARTAFDRATNQ